MRTTMTIQLPFICFGLFLGAVLSRSVMGDFQTNAADEFFIAIPKNSFNDETINLLITTQDSGYVQFSVVSNNFFYIGGVSNGSFNTIELPETLELQNKNDRNKGIRICTIDQNKKISVYFLKEGQYLSGGLLVLPSKQISGMEQYTYYITSYLWDNRVTLNPHSGAVIVGCYNNTQIIITPTQNITIPSDLQSPANPRDSISSGESYNVTLDALQTYDFDSILDLTGTRLISNKPISVFAYHECADIPMGTAFCDYIVEQLPPTINWGRFFHLSSLNSRTASVRYKILGMSFSTSATLLCTIRGQTLPETTIQRYYLSGLGQAYEFEVRENRFCSLQANKPILLVQYSPGYSIDRIGDPFMLNIPPVEQYTNNYTLRADTSFSNHMTITVAVSHFNPERIYVDRKTIPSSNWTPIYCSSSVVCGYGTMFSILAGTHYVYHSNIHAKINVLVYGFEYHTAYGFLGGMELNWISGVCQHGDVQLVPLPGSVDTAGKVEVCIDGVWSNICGRGWSNHNAVAVCRQLGYSSQGVSAYSGHSHNRVAWPYIISAVNCNGSEAQLLDCLYSTHFAECGLAEVAYVHCQPISNLCVITDVISGIHTRSPATVSCTALLSSSISDDVTINITWNKDNRQLHGNSDILIVSANLTNNEYQSNLTILVLEASDDGLYTCSAGLTSRLSNQLISEVTSSIYLNVEGTSHTPLTTLLTDVASSSLIFQMRLVGVGHCSIWLLQFSTPAEKITQVTSTIVDNVLARCDDCGLTMNHITDGAFHCFVQDAHEVTFRARLYASPTTTPMQLINHIISWIENGASMALSGILLSVDWRCDIVIESFSEPECSEQQITTQTITTVTTQDGSVIMATSQSVTTPFTETTKPIAKTTTAPPDGAFIANVTIASASVIYARSPATLTCTAMLSGTINNDVTVHISWSKDGLQLHNSSETMITTSNATTPLYHSNLTIRVLETSDSGFYTCRVLLSQTTQVLDLPPSISTVHLVVQVPSSLLFQLRLIGVGYCSEWLLHFSTFTERMAQVIKAIVDNTITLCGSCGLTANHIADGGFQCFTQGAHEVTFRAHLYATPTSTPQELITHITHWVKNGASIAISGLLLTIDRRCDIVIESFSKPECYQVAHTTEPLALTTAEMTTTEKVTIPSTTVADSTTLISRTASTASQQLITSRVTDEISNLSFSVEAIIIGGAVVMVIFIIAVMVTIVIVACLCAKYCSSHHNRQPPANQLVPSSAVSAVTPFPLPSYEIVSADVKTELEETKELPPDYSAPSTPVTSEIPSYCWEPVTAL